MTATESKNVVVQSIPSWTWLLLFAICSVLFIAGGISYYYDKKQETKKEEQVKANSVKITQKEQVTQEKEKILRFEGYTPCEPNMDFVFLLETYGDSVSLSFPGIQEPVKYYGKGLLPVLEDRTSGNVPITSLNPRKKARITIWEIQ